MKTTINDLINALYQARNDGRMVANIEKALSGENCCLTGFQIECVLKAYNAGQFKGQGACIFSDMLMCDEMLHVAETAIVEGVAQVVDAYHCGGLVAMGDIVTTLIEDQLKEQPEYGE